MISTRFAVFLVADLFLGITTDAATGEDLQGLWQAQKRFGADARVPLIVEREGAHYVADVFGKRIPIVDKEGELAFDLPDHQGAFRGKFEGQTLAAHWFRPPTPVNNGQYVSPIVLTRHGINEWRGRIDATPDEFTFFLLLSDKRANGSFAALLRNPEFDYGSQQGVEELKRDGNAVKLIGKRHGKETDVATGVFNAENQVLTLNFPDRGGSYDFRRGGADSGFYARGEKPDRYTYRSPPSRDDAWPTATLDEVNINRSGIERFIQQIVDAPMSDTDAPQVHAVLIARHGKLALEEYFHGEHRDKLHGTRSAAKVVTATLAGAAMHAGAPLKLSSPIYRVMNGGDFPGNLDAQKRSMTLEHLLTMSSGFFCDDANDDAPGNENRMLDQTEQPDYYRYTLDVALATTPGEKAVYCSCNPNLALGVVARATGEYPTALFDRLVGKPMKIDSYSWPADPAGNAYGGGGIAFLPRDFLKFGQLMLNHGMWQGRQILDREFAARATTPHYHLSNITYGYTWWGEDFPYKKRTVHAFMALGAGGQTVTVVPDLDLVVGIFAGNYNSKGSKDITHHYVPRFILPAVREHGDDDTLPVTETSYTSPYGISSSGGRVQKGN